MNVNFSGSTGGAYNITTGRDDNGDFFFNDRPAGFARNAGRGDGQWNLNASLNYGMTFGKPAGGSGGGGGGGGGIAIPAGMPIMMGGMMEGQRVVAMAAGGPQQPGRYRMSIFLRIANVTNHANPFGYSAHQLSGCSPGQPGVELRVLIESTDLRRHNQIDRIWVSSRLDREIVQAPKRPK